MNDILFYDHEKLLLRNPHWDCDHGFSPRKELLPHDAVWTRQVHGTRGAVVHESSRAVVPTEENDWLYTSERNVCLAIQTADCLPILIYDPLKKCIAAVHAGWRGVTKRILRTVINTMQEKGSVVSDLEVAIGPSISCAQFEVGSEVIEKLTSGYADVSMDWNILYRAGALGKFHVNLAQVVSSELQHYGIEPLKIKCTTICTKSDLNWQSYRRQGQEAGRNWCWIAMRS